MTTPPWLQHPAMRWGLGALGALVLLHLVAFLLLLALRGAHADEVLPNVTVAGEAVGGLDREELGEVVDTLATARLERPVEVTAGVERVETDARTLGLRVARQETTRDAWQRGRRGLWRALGDQLGARFGWSNDVELLVETEDTSLERWSRQAARALSREPRPASLGFEVVDAPDEVEVVTTDALPGQDVEATDVRAALADELEGTAPIVVEVPTVDTQAPEVTDADREALLPDAELAVSAPVVLTNPSAADDLVLRPADLAEVLEVVDDPDATEGQRLRLRTDTTRLVDHLGEEQVEAFDADPVEAEIGIADGEVTISGGTPGFELDLEATAETVVEVALQEDPREADLPGATDEPEFTREDAEQLEIVEEVSSFTTPMVPGESRNENIGRAAELLRGQLIEPGDSLSLDEALGPRTRERGFVENGFIEEDGDLGSVVGGGTSQLATTFLNAAWFAGIEIVEFQPHSQHFDRYPVGHEATISRGTIDVVITNDSPHGILVWTSASEEDVTVSFWSTSWAQVDSWTSEPRDVEPGDERDGFTVDFGRDITYPDGSTRSEEHTHRYEPDG